MSPEVVIDGTHISIYPPARLAQLHRQQLNCVYTENWHPQIHIHIQGNLVANEQW